MTLATILKRPKLKRPANCYVSGHIIAKDLQKAAREFQHTAEKLYFSKVL